MVKKIIVKVLIILFGLNQCVFAENLKGISSSVKNLRNENYNEKTVLKYYTPYEVRIKNSNSYPVLLTTNSEIELVLEDGTVLKSQSRRDLYKRSRKRDMGRYYGLGIPGAIIGGGVTGITLFIGAPIGAAIMIGMYVPVDKAVRSNVKISQELYNTYTLPIRFEANQTYPVRFYLPKKSEVKTIRITNVAISENKIGEIEIPMVSL